MLHHPIRLATDLATSTLTTDLKLLALRHRRLLRAAWLVTLVVLAACQNDGSGGDGGY